MTMTTIRTYDAADHAALVDLFARAGVGSPTGELWGHAESERAVYLDPYVEHCPDSLFLAEHAGRLVGYLTGCPDPSSMPGEDEVLVRAIARPRVLLRPRTLRFMGRTALDAARAALRREPLASGTVDDPRWPAHLHINVAPEARGTGAADALMAAWLRRLDEAGVPGCYLQTLVENHRAVRFFERVGFTVHGPTPLVPGIRHEGRRMHQLTMVRPAGE
ncbi:GNAT family N-acetyltransferase [Pseudonocardia parietis]|uniref:Ribosomal protein S18 acetylase RimI-like enzyme n=1 Tax=Pseudonocardia parietis TaxID=570936 RepID=A0ABS4VZA2_9PSEU|nr:GNAT family N-acetyltransferase [Pseudonocardia parietis]MBP2369269.1 ribosomal protein S18 acetylase RimI-like enzyme [Pseudonocardia parietis]